jgi:flagellar biogenesis protein FliO
MDGLSLLARVLCVFALLGLVLWALRRTDGRRNGVKRTADLQVLGSTRLGKGAALTVVRVGGSEYVLGVTEQSVTLLTPGRDAPAETPVEEPVRLAVAPRADLRKTVTDQLLGRRPAARKGATTPPTTAAFLRDAYRVARGRHAESTDLSPAAVASALAGVRGEEPAASPTPETLQPVAPAAEAQGTRSQPAARAADGSAARTASSRHAGRRAVARTDALRDEEHPWTRACRPAFRTPADGAELL